MAPNASTTRPRRSSSAAAPARRSAAFGVELDHLGDQQHLAGEAAIGEGLLQPLIDEALMRSVLIDDDEGGLGLGDDEGVVHLRPRGAERIGDGVALVGARMGGARSAWRRGQAALAPRSAKPKARGDAWCEANPADGRAMRASASCDRLAVARCSRRPSASCSAVTISARTACASRNLSSVLAGCTFTSTSSGGSVRNSASIGCRPFGTRSP